MVTEPDHWKETTDGEEEDKARIWDRTTAS